MDRYTARMLIILLITMVITTIKNKPVSMCTWNSRGLCAAVPYLRKLSTEYDLTMINEHWLHSNKVNRLSDINVELNYCARSSKYANADEYGSVRGQGGVAILWKKTLPGITPLNNIIHDRICGVRLENSHGAVFNILNVYMPAAGSDECFENAMDELSAIMENLEVGSYTVIGGDLNADLGSLGGCRGTKKPNKNGKYLAGFLSRHNLYAANLASNATGPVNTFMGPNGHSCIDYFLVPNDLVRNIKTCSTKPWEVLNTSDHNPVTIAINFGMVLRTTIKLKPSNRTRWDKLQKVDLARVYTMPITKKLNDIFNRASLIDPTEADIDNLLEELVNVLKKAEKVVPKTKFKRNLKPYWCPILNDLKANKVLIYREWCAAGKPRSGVLFRAHKQAESTFRKKLKQISREYESEKVLQASKSAELDKNEFWRILKREKSGGMSSFTAVKNKEGKTVYNIEQVLEVWAEHFDSLSTPKQDASYNQAHFDFVNRKVAEFISDDSIDEFTREYFSTKEVSECIKKLKPGKSPGPDGITKEHLSNAGDMLPKVLMLIFKWIVTLEYVPKNFRQGVQVPLHKGKNTSILDTNNFRGITLLNTFNKIFEMLIWSRLKDWWTQNDTISSLQGACRTGLSCVHTTMLMQETIAEKLETHAKVYVLYLDVSKAFDGVWVNGLFYRLHCLGVRGRVWRLLYKCYLDFTAKVRIHDHFSRSYKMDCGIHQGGYLSLLKYISFIDSLLVDLEKSKICCTINGISTTPLGYADDMATATTSKYDIDKVLKIVHLHSREWRYDFNAKKSAIVVYGEGERDNKINSQYRMYKLGGEKVKEQDSYEHLGLMTFNQPNCNIRTKDKVGKGRRALSAASGIGIKNGGVSMKACNTIFWSMIVPIITFAAELWILNDTDVEVLEEFQKYAGRRIQRLHPRAPSVMSYATLGWIRLENFINIKKMLFVRTIIVLDDNSIHKRILKDRVRKFIQNPEECILNRFYSPLYDILRILYIYDMLDSVIRMLNGTHWFSKTIWKNMVWHKAWLIEDRDWELKSRLFNNTRLYNKICDVPMYCVWWKISDVFPALIRQCENMVKLICRASKLKVDDYKFKNRNVMCTLCDNYAREDTLHIILQCHGTEQLRNDMQTELIRRIGRDNYGEIANRNDYHAVLMGSCPDNISEDTMMVFWTVVCIYVSRMYWYTLKNREGVG